MMTGLMAISQFPELQRVCNDLGFPLTEDSLNAFDQFEDALYRWNEHKNLTRIPREHADVRHFAESCLIADLVEGDSLLDIGTGPGLPAWPLAVLLPSVQVTAVDSNGKMLDFLRSQPLENLTCIAGRVEDKGWREMFSTVTGRALAPLTMQLEVSAQACTIGGVVIPFRTTNDVLEGEFLEKLGLKLERIEDRTLSDGVVRRLPLYRKVAKTPPQYPRPWGKIRKSPLV